MKIIDMHCHIIPSVDDGPDTRRETVEMLRLQKQEGVVGIIATPHYRLKMFEPDAEEVRRKFLWVQEIAKRMGIRTWLGNECHIHDELEDYLERGICRTMVNSPYILVEFSSYHSYNIIRQYLMELIASGYIPIIAHIERISAFEKSYELVSDLTKLGVKIQVNAESVMGERGTATKRWMLKLMKMNLIHYIASDSHDTKNRVPNLGKCYCYVSKKLGKDYAEKVFYKNQLKIIKQRGGNHE